MCVQFRAERACMRGRRAPAMAQHPADPRKALALREQLVETSWACSGRISSASCATQRVRSALCYSVEDQATRGCPSHGIGMGLRAAQTVWRWRHRPVRVGATLPDHPRRASWAPDLISAPVAIGTVPCALSLRGCTSHATGMMIGAVQRGWSSRPRPVRVGASRKARIHTSTQPRDSYLK